MSRLCMRPGCDRDAASRLSYDAVGCQVWLDELTERAGRHQEICRLHAERLTVPRGWFLCDRRSDQPAMFVAPEPAPAPAPTGSSRRRRRTTTSADPAVQTLELFEVLRQELAEPAATLAAIDEPQPEPEPEPESVVAVPEEETPALLRATSPLLARAFAASGHQRSVLTQPGPTQPGPTQPSDLLSDAPEDVEDD